MMPRNVDGAIVRAFLTVVETGSVTKAARLLNLSQGAISQQIKRLEDHSDSPLFARLGRRLVLTPEGRRLIGPAQRFLSSNDEVWAALRSPVLQDEVRFGAPYTIVSSYAPPLLRAFRKEFPSVRVTVICKDTRPLLTDLKSGKIDLALTNELHCGRSGETLRTDRLVWVGAPNGGAYAKDPLPLALGARSCAFRPIAVTALRKAGWKWQLICEVSNMEPVRAMVEADMAIAPLLRHAVPDTLEVLRARRLPKLPVFRINLYQSARPNRAAREFVAHARRCVSTELPAYESAFEGLG